MSEGRCSRGVFAEFHRTEDTIALVLDTEGLQSAERADPEFDRLMMLFTLAVSNRVDVVVKGMMTEPLPDCHRSSDFSKALSPRDPL